MCLFDGNRHTETVTLKVLCRSLPLPLLLDTINATKNGKDGETRKLLNKTKKDNKQYKTP